LVMVVKDTKGVALTWLEAKEMCEGGCQSLVPIRRVKEGRERSVLIKGVTVRPCGTARVPDCRVVKRSVC